MNLFGYRYVSRSLGFAMGWLYWYSLGILVPYEITAAALVIEYWEPPVSIAVWITIMIVVIVALNLLPVKFYGETEFWFAGTKIIMMIGLLFVSVILFFGGGPNNDRLGFRYWRRPRAANTFIVTSNEDTGRFLALLRTWVSSSTIGSHSLCSHATGPLGISVRVRSRATSSNRGRGRLTTS